MSFLVAGHQYIVLVFSLLADASMGSDPVAVLPVVVPLAFVLETVRPFRDTKTTAFIVFPFSHVGFSHAGIKLFILQI